MFKSCQQLVIILCVRSRLTQAPTMHETMWLMASLHSALDWLNSKMCVTGQHPARLHSFHFNQMKFPHTFLSLHMGPTVDRRPAKMELKWFFVEMKLCGNAWHIVVVCSECEVEAARNCSTLKHQNQIWMGRIKASERSSTLFAAVVGCWFTNYTHSRVSP